EDQPDRLVVTGEPAALHTAEEHQLCPEAFCLSTGQPRQLCATDSVREAEEVFDHRRIRGLAPGYVPVAHDRRGAVGGGGAGGRQTRGAGSDDGEVVVRLLRRL